MAGNGPPPKSPEQRRRRNEPLRGEWVDLEPLPEPVLPEASADWSKRVARLWNAWRDDPVTSQYGPADLAAIWDLAEQFEGLGESTQTKRMEVLGLTPKGKRDLRWRTPAEVATIAGRRPTGPRKLRAV